MFVMINIAYFLAASLLLLTGHIFKMLRWKQFIEIYEEPDSLLLLRALSVGFIANSILPFQVGDIFRIILSGRKMQNGYAFSTATIVVDHILDVPIVGTIFLVFLLYSDSTQNSALTQSVIFYAALMLGIIMLGILAYRHNQFIKKATKKICSVFNSRINFRLLFFFWSGITACKDIFFKLNRKRLLLYTLGMWGSYLASYWLIAFSIQSMLNVEYRFIDIMLELFGFAQKTGNNYYLLYKFTPSILVTGFMVCPIVILILYSFICHSKKTKSGHNIKYAPDIKRLNLLPQINERERLSFLDLYFSGSSSNYVKSYLALNQDVSVLQDYSAGSNATTILCRDGSEIFFRKYAFGKYRNLLEMQLNWLYHHKEVLPVTQIIRERRNSVYCCYDMKYNVSAINLFQYIHASSIEESWSLLLNVLHDIENGLHSKNVRPCSSNNLDEYIGTKVERNIKRIISAKGISHLNSYETLIINGRKCLNLKSLLNYYQIDVIKEVFTKDYYADIHGDLTIENIISCNNGKSYYLIDPLPNNFHESPTLDYSKLLQSLHGGYEFVNNSRELFIQNNVINYLFMDSHNYNELFVKYRHYLIEHLDWNMVRSIFYHEIVHWLRLMPYKIEKADKNMIIYYTRMIVIMNDIMEWYS